MVGFLSYDPIVRVEIAGRELSPHSLGIVTGFFAGALVMLSFARLRGIKNDQIYPVLFWAAFGAAVGGRLGYIVDSFGEYDRPLDVLRLWEGGFSLVGGMAGAALFAYPAIRAESLAFWQVMDAAAPGVALATAVARLGDVVVADHLGKATDLLLGYECTAAETASPCVAPLGLAVHHTALYDLVSTTALFLVLLVLARRPHYDGFLFLVFALWYGTARFVLDFFRVDETHGSGLTFSQWGALVVTLFALYWLVVTRESPAFSRSESHARRAPR